LCSTWTPRSEQIERGSGPPDTILWRSAPTSADYVRNKLEKLSVMANVATRSSSP